MFGKGIGPDCFPFNFLYSIFKFCYICQFKMAINLFQANNLFFEVNFVIYNWVPSMAKAS